ncbi:MAG: universal stress protein [Myxococcota bacterium]
MLDLDQVESQFRATVKVRPALARPSVEHVVVVSDATTQTSTALLEDYQAFLAPLGEGVRWTILPSDETKTVGTMLEAVQSARPDLVVAARHLFEDDVDLPYSLGTHADMLTQAIRTPVLLTPHPRSASFPKAIEPLEKVLVVTDHIVGDDRLVSWGLRLAEKGGNLCLAHVEDDAVFRRYIEAISKIPDLDTGFAERAIDARLLGDARIYMDDIAAELAEKYPEVTVAKIVERGHTVTDHTRLVKEQGVDLVVMNTKDDSQQAMHGVAYSLAVELVHIPLLLL